MNSALLSCGFSSTFGFFAVVVLELPPPPPQPLASRASEHERRQGKERISRERIEIEASSGIGLLRPRDSNPDCLFQREVCCHYTRAQRDLGG